MIDIFCMLRNVNLIPDFSIFLSFLLFLLLFDLLLQSLNSTWKQWTAYVLITFDIPRSYVYLSIENINLKKIKEYGNLNRINKTYDID